MYTESELVRIAKRENNKKRNYLVVNRLQGKHIPVSPSQALTMFQELSKLLKENYPNETLLLIGFAETATAIGAAVAVNLDCYYTQTTREQVENADYLYFTESHSHATQQKLVKNNLQEIIDQIDRIVFIEDEITTGKTILKIVRLLKEFSGEKQIKFAAASLLNGMKEKHREIWEEEGIEIHYLVKTDHEKYSDAAEKFAGDGIYHNTTEERPSDRQSDSCYFSPASGRDYADIPSIPNPRRIVKSQEYKKACELFAEKIQKNAFRRIQDSDRSAQDNNQSVQDSNQSVQDSNQSVQDSNQSVQESNQSAQGSNHSVQGSSRDNIQKTEKKEKKEKILVLGTEECMYPGLCVAQKLSELGLETRFHATTRSPIIVSTEENYPLHERYQLKSFYDKDRITYLYDLAQYTKVYVITDASYETSEEGRNTLRSALAEAGNETIEFYYIR